MAAGLCAAVNKNVAAPARGTLPKAMSCGRQHILKFDPRIATTTTTYLLRLILGGLLRVSTAPPPTIHLLGGSVLQHPMYVCFRRQTRPPLNSKQHTYTYTCSSCTNRISDFKHCPAMLPAGCERSPVDA
jgi:hypothetical protein